MACILTQGFTLDCREQGGLSKLYLASYSSISGSTEATGEVTAIDLAVGENFYEYELIQETAGWTETITVSEENHSHMFEQELTFFIPNKSASKRNEILLLARANVVAIVEENDGTLFFLGKDRGLILGGDGVSGTSYEDRNGYELSLSGTQREPAPTVAPTIIAGLL